MRLISFLSILLCFSGCVSNNSGCNSCIDKEVKNSTEQESVNIASYKIFDIINIDGMKHEYVQYVIGNNCQICHYKGCMYCKVRKGVAKNDN